MATMSSAQSLRILCLDGGGVKGYAALLILKRIFRTLVAEGSLDEEPKPCDVFDLIIGTSTGGLIAIMLGRLRMSLDECIKQYEIVGVKVFGKKPLGGQVGKLLKGITKSSFYDIKILQNEIKSILKERGISEKAAFSDASSPKCRVAVCVTRKRISKPDVLRSYETKDPSQANFECNIWEAASATAAAPLYFKPVQFEVGGELWCDGGLYRNNPINEAIAEIKREWEEKPIGCIISLGTGVPKISNVSDNLAKFLRGAVDIMTASDETATAFAHSPYGQDLAASRRYFRFSVPQGMQDLELDECNETGRMKDLTDNYLRQYDIGREILSCAKSLLFPDENIQQGVKHKPSHLPYNPCSHYVERRTYSTALEMYFKPNFREQQRFVLWGMGGVGKTQIALRFAHSVKHRLCVFWVRADTELNFLNDFCGILRILDPSKCDKPEAQDRFSQAAIACEKLEGEPTTWILILDNADDWDIFMDSSRGNSAIRRHLPKNGAILLTSRDPRFIGTFAAASAGLHVEPMDDEEGKGLLLKSIPSHLAIQRGSSTVTELLEDLGYLPLAIAQAAANIQDQQTQLHDYIAAYRQKRDRMDLMREPTRDMQTTDPRTQDQSIYVTWELSFDILQLDSATCLNYMGFFHPRDVPSFVLRNLPEFKSLTKYQFRNVIKRLLHLSLIEETTYEGYTEFSIHPVVHERVYSRISLLDRSQYLTASIEVIATIFPTLVEDPSDIMLGHYLLPHALTQVEIAEELEIKTQPLARLLQTVAGCLGKLGMTELALSLATKSVEMGRLVWGPDNISTFHVWREKLACLNAQGQYSQAYEEADKFLESFAKLPLDKTPNAMERLDVRAFVLNVKSFSCRRLGRYEESEEIGRELLSCRSEFAERLDNLMVTQHSIANSLRSQGRLREALNMTEDLLAAAKRDNNHSPWLERMRLNLVGLKSLILQSMRTKSVTDDSFALTPAQHAEILEGQEQAYTGLKELDGIQDFATWQSCTDFASELFNLGRSADAANLWISILEDTVQNKPLIEGRLLDIFRHSFTSALQVVGHLFASGDRDSITIAYQLYELLSKSAESIRSSFDAILSTPESINAFAVVLQQRGKFQEAEVSHRRALNVQWSYKMMATDLLEDVIHYNIMLAIARQDRVSDAYTYREQFSTKIARAEAIHGELSKRLEYDWNERVIYNRAKSKVDEKGYILDNIWWEEYKSVLNRTQLKYGQI